MSSKLKIFQYHNVHLYNLKQYRIALEVGVYNSMEGFLSVLGSNQRLAWEFKKWLPTRAISRSRGCHEIETGCH